MPVDVRVVDEDPVRRGRSAGGRPGRRQPWGWVLAGLVVVTVVVMVIALVHPRGGGGPVLSPSVSTSVPGAPATGTAGLDVAVAVGAAWRAGMSVPVIRELVPGLPMCDATLGGWTATRDGYGVEFPHTIAGAVGFAAEVSRWFWSDGYVVDAQRHDLVPLLFLPDAAPSEEVAVATREAWGVDAQGRVLTGADQGLVSWFNAYPEYGAFKVHMVDRAGHVPTGTGDVEEVVVSWFLPIVNGIDSKTTTTWDHVATWFVVHTLVVIWTDSGWRVMSMVHDNSVPGSDSGRDVTPHMPTNLSYPVLHALLGDGWCVPRDGTQQGSPTKVHSRA